MPHTMPLSLIGPREASESQKHSATLIGSAFAFAGVPVLCGGKSGVMEAGAAGVRSAGGLVIGLLPEDDADAANPYLSVALPTGLGITRNALIARAALCLIAVGGGLGTLSEMALGRQWNKRVLTIEGAPDIAGVECFEEVESLLLRLATDLAHSPRNRADVA
ncbi:lysine decarboxylase [Robbsia sp. KACC 23696]|uniref:SLOG cluster 4 domain-containing protein n=1 Tax=Robbsia sp. KACC 23696 TaxID=3149231 RepID=UPI00325AE051